ncbi:MAG: LysE family translocator [Rhodospirillaceae bacterium]|nr:LysE family translocator [Rhodospirillaceae bacterium]
MVPIDASLFTAFCLATAVLIMIPGPIVTLVVANSISRGTRFGVASVAGASLGSGLLIIVGAFGMTSLLAILADWFDILRWAGAAYLVYLGIRQWRATPVALANLEPDSGPLKGVFLHGFVVAITNPKTIFFYAAFFPQFIDPTRALAPQLALMSAAFLIIAVSIDGAYAVLAGRLRFIFVSQSRARLRNRLVGGLLIATGIGLAAARRT